MSDQGPTVDIFGQDGTPHALTPEQADQYYRISDFQARQNFLKTTGVRPSLAGPAPGPSSLAVPTSMEALPGVIPPTLSGMFPKGVPTLAAPTFGDPSNPLHAIGMEAAKQYGVPWNVFYHQTAGESQWNPNIGKSSAGAQGISQFIPSTAKTYGVDVNDPKSSLFGQARYMSDLYKQAGSWTGALTGYLTGKPGGPIPTSVLRSNPAYAEAYKQAALADKAGGVPARMNALVAGGALPKATGVPLAAPGGAPQAPPAGTLSQGTGAPSATTSGGPDMAKIADAVSKAGATTSPWQKLMMISMIQQLSSQGTHQFTPISYDPWKAVPAAAAPSYRPIVGSKGEPIGYV